MATMTIRLPDEKQKRLAQLARHLWVGVNKLIDEIATVRMAQFDAEIHFRRLAKKGSIQQGLKVLEKLDRAFAKAKRDRTALDYRPEIPFAIYQIAKVAKVYD